MRLLVEIQDNGAVVNKVQIRELYGKVGKAVCDYSLIDDGDSVLVGVSGGKDSLALLTVLAERAKSSKVNYRVVAAHIRSAAVSYKTDETFLQTLCTSLGVELYCETVDVKVRDGSGKPECFVCAMNRRKKLFEIARKTGCKKIAFGHHRDDAIVSLLMGMLFNGTISSMPAKLALFGGELYIIRPLIYLSERETAEFAEWKGFPMQEKNCPYEKATNRERVAELLKEIEKIAPDARHSLFAAMSNIKYDYLP